MYLICFVIAQVPGQVYAITMRLSQCDGSGEDISPTFHFWSGYEHGGWQ